MANRNILAARVFVDELARSGLKHAVLAPGSRHTPLVLAFAEHPDITVYSHLDERSASFYALGLALGTDQPVALCCTSGTAGANFYPAIIEAHQSRVPLIVLTADRPPELRHSGANQTIDQIKMFGDFVLWFVDAALPEANPPAVATRNLRTTADRAYATANGLRKGVVHINMPFRKPLEPTPVEGDVVEVPEGAAARNFGPFTQIHTSAFNGDYGETFGYDALGEENGIVVCGRGISSNDIGAIVELAENLRYPIIADILSGLRYPQRLSENMVGSGENFFTTDVTTARTVLRFGELPLSKRLNAFLSVKDFEHYICVTSDAIWSDDVHRLTDLVQLPAEEFCYQMMPWARTSTMRRDISWIEGWQSREYLSWEEVETQLDTGLYFDGGVAYDIVDLIPPESTLFAGNSLPIRLLDQFGKPQDKRIYVHANRGASGIDGNISTALGLGKARPDKPLVALIGDVTFYHDMNGLLAVHRCGVPVTIVLLNNNGGGIFHRLPIKDYDPHFTDLFVTPHGLDYQHAAKLYGMDFVRLNGHAPDARAQFRKVFSERVELSKAGQSTIIEVMTDAKTDLARRDEIVKAVHEAINDRHKDTNDTET